MGVLDLGCVLPIEGRCVRMTNWETLQRIIEQHEGSVEWVAEALYAWLVEHSEDDQDFMAALTTFLKGSV